MAVAVSTTGSACNRGQSNQNKSLIGSIMDAAAVAAAVINTAAAIKMADLQYDIAKQYLDIAKWWRKYYNNTYKPWEDVELKEAWALSTFDPMYDITVGRTRTFGRLQFRGVVEQSMRCSAAACTGLRSAKLKDIINAEASTLASLSNMGYRNERAYKEARDNTRWERRLQVLNRGRDLLANNIQFSSMAAGIFGSLGKQAGAGAAGAIRYLGYSWNKNETLFPTMARGSIQEAPAEAAPVASYPTPQSSRPVTSGYSFDPETGEYRPAW